MNITQDILFFPAPPIQPVVLFLQGKIRLSSHCPTQTAPFFDVHKNTAGKLKQEMLFSRDTEAYLSLGKWRCFKWYRKRGAEYWAVWTPCKWLITMVEMMEPSTDPPGKKTRGNLQSADHRLS